jgi:hypothetical protein
MEALARQELPCLEELQVTNTYCAISLEALQRAPWARRLRLLRLECCDFDVGGRVEGGALVAADLLALTRLDFCFFNEHSQRMWTDDLTEAVAAWRLPSLVELSLCTMSHDDAMQLLTRAPWASQLTDLCFGLVEDGGPRALAFAAAPLGALRRLSLLGDIPGTAVQALAAAPWARALEALSIEDSEDEPSGWEAVAAAPMPGLRSFILHLGLASDKAIRRVAEALEGAVWRGQCGDDFQVS